MNWQKQITEIEERKEWVRVIELLEDTIEKTPLDVEPYISIIYYLHNLLLEVDYANSGLTEKHLANLLLKYFRSSHSIFSNNSEYLFFVGSIIHVAEWYFGQSDVSLALQMQKRATELEPANILYEFSYRFSLSDQSKAFELAKKILFNDSPELNWLKSKGFAGRYQIGTLKYCYDNNKSA
jgi:hypothetical protein